MPGSQYCPISMPLSLNLAFLCSMLDIQRDHQEATRCCVEVAIYKLTRYGATEGSSYSSIHPLSIRPPIQQCQSVNYYFVFELEVQRVVQLRPYVERFSAPWSYWSHSSPPPFPTCLPLSSQQALWPSLSKTHIIHLRSSISDITTQTNLRHCRKIKGNLTSEQLHRNSLIKYSLGMNVLWDSYST